MRYFVTNTLRPLQYISSGNLISRQDFLHPKRNIDTFVFILVKEGSLYINLSGTNYTVLPNQYVFLKSNEEHFGFQPSQGKLSYLWTHFLLPDHLMEYHNEKIIIKELHTSADMQGKNLYIMPEFGEISLLKKVPLLFNQLLDFSRQEQLYSSQISNYALSLLIMEITQEFFDKQNEYRLNIPPRISHIMEWIRANYYKPLTVASIANEFGYNPDYLSAYFKKITKRSLTNFINNTRVDISKSLIINYGVSIKEAAYSCGFCDEKYYMKIFKKIENITPSQYKKAFTDKRIN